MLGRVGGYNRDMPIRTIVLSLAALVCFAAAYRFGSHGIRLHDNLCIGLAGAALTVAVVLLGFAFRTARRQQS
jgi:hypothetical protein